MPAKNPSDLKFDMLSAGLMMSFCPWCGANLFTFYGKEMNIDDYVNEVEGETF
jgi:predicted  nucleic acid-binding Zn-ribbon protein